MINQTNSLSAAPVVQSEFQRLVEEQGFLRIPNVGDLVKGSVVSLGKNEIRLDIPGYKSGVVRGFELFQSGDTYQNLKVGDDVEATVIDINNEKGEVELSLRFVGLTRVWGDLSAASKDGRVMDVKISEVNKGGLMVTMGQIVGFIPVSQLAPEHYPRVQGGDKSKILEKLKEFQGKTFRVKVIDVSPEDGKLIFSEKAVWEEEQKDILSRYKIGDIVEGDITAIADFGVFVAFDGLEGLIHISEIAWQRLDHPGDLLKVGDHVKAQIVGIERSKIFLSIRRLMDDPWKNVGIRYAVGQEVTGKVLKVNPFGLFVELDPEIHGLAHVSELDLAPGERLEDKIKPGSSVTFKVISIEPEAHRLGLSVKALHAIEAPAESKPEETQPEQTEPSPPVADVKTPPTDVPNAQ